MTKSIFILTVVMALGGGLMAQEKQSPVKKGYYSIGNNQDKLPQTKLRMERAEDAPSVTKGYYSIANNNEQLQKGFALNLNGQTPKTNKGYYGIKSKARKQN